MGTSLCKLYGINFGSMKRHSLLFHPLGCSILVTRRQFELLSGSNLVKLWSGGGGRCPLLFRGPLHLLLHPECEVLSSQLLLPAPVIIIRAAVLHHCSPSPPSHPHPKSQKEEINIIQCVPEKRKPINQVNLSEKRDDFF